MSRAIEARWPIRAAVAAVLSTNFAGAAFAADAVASEEKLEEVQITGSRIVRRDTETTSPLLTVDKEVLEKSSYVSIEQALNELPEFMAGGALMGSAAVSGLTAAGNVAGGNGTGNMFDTARPVDNARVGSYTPGAATVNLRGLGPNRSLTLIDGRRAISSNASGAIDLNTVPQIAIANIEVITGGASSVYGADALAGVTNIKLREKFDGVQVRARGGMNEAGGDGKEWQLSSLIGLSVGEKGHAIIAMDYSKREMSLWKNRSWFRDAMESPLSNSGNLLFQAFPGYQPPNTPTATTTTSTAINAGGGTQTVFNNAWAGNSPTQAAINQVFADRSCIGINCITPTSNGGGFFFNKDGTLFTPSSSTAPVAGITTYYGPQSFTGTIGGTEANPLEVACNFAANSVNTLSQFSKYSCNPTVGYVDYGRRLTSPRESYTLFGKADYNVSEHVSAYSAISFASSQTETRREPVPLGGGFGVSIPYNSDPTVKYLPSMVQAASGTLKVGDTLPEYRVGGKRGTNCPDVGGCTMQQAFPVSPELAVLLNSRPDVTLNNAASPFNGLSVCDLRQIDSNAATAGHFTQRVTAGGVAYSVQTDPNTGDAFKICGPNSAWRLQNQLMYLPPRGTFNNETTYQLTAGLKGDVGLRDWTWDAHLSQGQARTATEYVGYVSSLNYSKIISAPNYGMGYREDSSGVNNKTITCTSGLNPFAQAAGTLQVSQDCLDAVLSNQTDRQLMQQFESELFVQGSLFELPAGDARAAFGVSYRKNNYSYIPDSLRYATYTADTSAGQFGVGNVIGSVAVKEIYGEFLLPLLKDLPAIRSLELELGYRYSQYTTGQDVPTYKAQLSWEPIDWLRVRGGYNRAERTPNIAELYTSPTVSSQLSGVGTDPCLTNVAGTLAKSNSPSNPDYLKVQALCSAQINFWGGANASTFHANPNNFTQAGGALVYVGNPDLKSEKGDTWTGGIVFNSPFSHPLAQRITATVDWYRIKITDPIDILSGQQILNACYNVDGQNPTYSLNDPGGYCALIEREPSVGFIRTVRGQYANVGELGVEGIDTSIRWGAALADMGMPSLPGNFSVSLSANFLIDQTQPVTVGGALYNYAGYGGASKIRTNTTLAYNWNANRVSLAWLFHQGTDAISTTTNLPQSNLIGYKSGSLFNLNGATKFGPLEVSATISNLLNTAPKVGGYFTQDLTNGFGTFDPYNDLVGRRYSLSLTLDF